jgi:A/G-specific adenine glycosylase
MLQQTQVATVLSYYSEWLRRFPDFKTLAAAKESEVLRAWQGLGYYARARNLHATAKDVMHSHGGIFPASVDKARELPGLGRYTANAVATFAFDQSVPIVEANTARLFARLLNLQVRIDSGAGHGALWKFATSLVPMRDAGAYNSALMDLGATICVAGEPRCSICPLRAFCRAESPTTLPMKKPRPGTKKLLERHIFVFRRGHILLQQSNQRWRGLWILPPAETTPRTGAWLHTTEFPFTNHRITLEVRAAPLSTRKRGCQQQWFSRQQLKSLPMPSPHRRALTAILESNAAFPNNGALDDVVAAVRHRRPDTTRLSEILRPS